MIPHMLLRRAPLGLALAVTTLALLGGGPVQQPDAAASSVALPLGDADLVEVRSVESLAAGVQLTRIVRGSVPAPVATMATTSRGPWRVNVLSIDPLRARGHLEATYGKDLAQVERATDLVKFAGGLAGVNASFFAFDRAPTTRRASRPRSPPWHSHERTGRSPGGGRTESVKLLALTARGCLTRRVTLFDELQQAVKLHDDMFGVAGRYRLTRSGRVVVPAGSDGFFARNPRTLAGTTAAGKILLVTVDGRRTTSVGTTLAETAAVAHALGMTNAVNLDGGGSTSMSVSGALTNVPGGWSERAVGDALVYVDRPAD